MSIEKYMPSTGMVIAGVMLAAAAYIILKKKDGESVAQSVGAAVGNAAGDLFGGAVMGLGDSIGIPRTNETECQKAMREGRTWDASFACPAGTFLGHLKDEMLSIMPVSRELPLMNGGKYPTVTAVDPVSNGSGGQNWNLF